MIGIAFRPNSPLLPIGDSKWSVAPGTDQLETYRVRAWTMTHTYHKEGHISAAFLFSTLPMKVRNRFSGTPDPPRLLNIEPSTALVLPNSASDAPWFTMCVIRSSLIGVRHGQTDIHQHRWLAWEKALRYGQAGCGRRRSSASQHRIMY